MAQQPAQRYRSGMAAELQRFERGENVVLRYITRAGDQPGMSWALRVVEDRDDLVALHAPAGSPYLRWSAPGNGRRRLEAGEWRREWLRLMFPGRQHSTWLFWEWPDGARAFRGYYVNLEEPFRRTPIGFDTNDHTLDIVVAPDLTWRWKDEDEFRARVADGSFSEEFGATVWAEAERVVEAIEGRRSPFCDGWEEWQPEASWEMPAFPEGWAEVPVAAWERRSWAYGRRG